MIYRMKTLKGIIYIIYTNMYMYVYIIENLKLFLDDYIVHEAI